MLIMEAEVNLGRISRLLEKSFAKTTGWSRVQLIDILLDKSVLGIEHFFSPFFLVNGIFGPNKS